MKQISTPEQTEPKHTDIKKKHIIRITWPDTLVMDEWITKPMTTEEFQDDILGRIEEGLLPFFIEGNRIEVAGDNHKEWDKLFISKFIIDNTKIECGIYYVK